MPPCHRHLVFTGLHDTLPERNRFNARMHVCQGYAAATFLCAECLPVARADDVPLVLTDEPSCADVRMSEERVAARLRSMLSQWHKSGSGAPQL